MEHEVQRAVNYFMYKGRKLKEPDDARLTPARCVSARLPKKLWKSVWTHYSNTYEPKILLRKYVDNLDKHRRDGKGLLLFGDSRKGKTCAASLVAKEIIRRDGFPLFVAAHHIAKIEVSKEEEDIELSTKMRNVAFLIIDDMGADSGRDKAASMLEQIIRDRDGEMLPTIITTNMNIATIKKEFGGAFMELLGEICIGVKFT